MKIGKLLLFILLPFNLWAQNTIEQIIFNGNSKTKEKLLKEIILCKEGDTFSEENIAKDIDFLKRLPSVQDAHYTTETINGKTVVKVNITERITIMPSFSAWLSEGRYWFQVGAAEFNAFGKNITLAGSYRYTDAHSYKVLFKAPYLFSRKLGLGFAQSNLGSTEPLYFKNPLTLKPEEIDDYKAKYLYRNLSNEVSLLYQADYRHNFELSLNPFQETYLYQEGANAISRDEKKDAKFWKFLTKFFYQYYAVKHHYHYLNGFANQVIYQNVQAGYTFHSLTNTSKYYKRIKDKGVLATRFIVGLGTNNDTPFAPFVIDNHLNVRGVGDRVNRGNATLTFNVEYRHTVYDKKWLTLEAVAFTDWASLQNAGQSLSTLGKGENIYGTSGIGARFHLKRIFGATLRLDYGFGLKDNSEQGLVVGIGQYF
jgi:outer membrane protein assembly factor BamA